MSVIGKKPFVNYIIDECSVDQTNEIISIMNNLGTPTEVALYGNQNLLSENNMGVSYVTLKIQDLTKIILNGILIYLDNTHCGFFGIASNSDNIVEYKINPVNLTFERLYEYLTIEELRQVCGDRQCSGGAAANVFYFQNGDELTEEIFRQLKNGDIIVVNDLIPFIITTQEYHSEYYVKGYAAQMVNPKGPNDIPTIYEMQWSNTDQNGLDFQANSLSGGGSSEGTTFYKHHIYLNVVEFEDGTQIHDYINENGIPSHEIIVINNDPEFRDFSLVVGREGIDGYAELCKYILSSFNAYFVDYASNPSFPPDMTQIVVAPNGVLKIWDKGILSIDDSNNTGHGFRCSGYGEIEVLDTNGQTAYVEVIGQGDMIYSNFMAGDNFKYFILSKEDIENDTDYPEDYPFVEELSFEDFDTFKVSLNNGGGK